MYIYTHYYFTDKCPSLVTFSSNSISCDGFIEWNLPFREYFDPVFCIHVHSTNALLVNETRNVRRRSYAVPQSKLVHGQAYMVSIGYVNNMKLCKIESRLNVSYSCHSHEKSAVGQSVDHIAAIIGVALAIIIIIML